MSIYLVLLMSLAASADDVAVGTTEVWDLDAQVPAECSSAEGVPITLAPGSYLIEAVDGTYLSWSRWSANLNCDPSGADCAQGYRTRASLFDVSSGVEAGVLASGNRYWDTPQRAFDERSSRPQTICVSQTTDYRLNLNDSSCSNNRGGQSVALSRLDDDCSAALCFGDISTGDSDADGTCDNLDVCPTLPDSPDVYAGSATGVIATVDTCLLPDRIGGGGCLTGGSNEAIITWTPPADGLYEISIEGSDPEVLFGLESDCALTELACARGTRIDQDLELTAGEPIRMVLNHRFAGQCGVYVVSAEACLDTNNDGACDLCVGDLNTGDTDDDGICDDVDVCVGDDGTGDSDGDGFCDDLDACPTLPDMPDLDGGSALGVIATVNTCGMPDRIEGGVCQTTDSSEVILTWTPPDNGRYEVSVSGTSPQMLIGFESDCAMLEIDCAEAPVEAVSALDLDVGEPLRMVINRGESGACGEYVVSVRTCIDNGSGVGCDDCLGDASTGDLDGDAVCDDLDLCMGDDATGDSDNDGVCADLDRCPTRPNDPDVDGGTALGTIAVVDTCGLEDRVGGGPCLRSGLPDALVTWEAPAAGTYTFSVDGPGPRFLLGPEADCAVTELACATHPATAESEVTLAAGEVVRMVVNRENGGSCGTYTVSVSEVAPLSIEMSWDVQPMVRGEPFEASVTGGPANRPIVMLASANVGGPAACPAQTAPACLGVPAPFIILAQGWTDANGDYTFPLRVPGSLNFDEVVLQAASLDGPLVYLTPEKTAQVFSSLDIPAVRTTSTVDSHVRTSGVVTAATPAGYFLQDLVATEYAGIWVEDDGAGRPVVGETVTLYGTFGEEAGGDPAVARAEIVPSGEDFVITGSASAPTPITLTPEAWAGDMEAYESMRITLQDTPLLIGTHQGGGSYAISSGGTLAMMDDLFYDYVNELTWTRGDEVTSVSGILNYHDGVHQVSPVTASDILGFVDGLARSGFYTGTVRVDYQFGSNPSYGCSRDTVMIVRADGDTYANITDCEGYPLRLTTTITRNSWGNYTGLVDARQVNFPMSVSVQGDARPGLSHIAVSALLNRRTFYYEVLGARLTLQ